MLIFRVLCFDVNHHLGEQELWSNDAGVGSTDGVDGREQEVCCYQLRVSHQDCLRGEVGIVL